MIANIKTLLLKNKEILLFLTVGSITAFIYFLMFFILWDQLKINYHMAVSTSYLTSVIFYFFANRQITFDSKHAAISMQLFKFLIMILLNYLITLIIVHFTVEVLSLPPYFGILFSILASTCSNYFIAKLWVFKTTTVNLNNISEESS